MPYLGNPAQQRFSSPRAASVYSGDGSTVAFTLEEVVSTDEDILVSVDGVIQEPSVAYAVSSGTTLTFTAAPSNNAGNNIFVYYIARTFGSVSMPDGQNVNASTGSFSGTVTANAGVSIDNITIDGTEIDLSSGDLTIDVAGDINLDADGGTVNFNDATTNVGKLIVSSNGGDFIMSSRVSDKDIVFSGNDGGSMTEVLRLDMSDAGTASFNHDVKLADNGIAIFGAGSDLQIYHDASESKIENATGNLRINNNASDSDIIFGVNDGGSVTEVARFDGSTASLAIIDGGGSQLDGGKISIRASGSTYNLITTRTTRSATGTNFVEFFNSSGDSAGKINHNGSTSVSYTTSSDYRLKENVVTEWDATTRLKQLKPSRFNFIAEADKTVDGFLAHEVSSIVPEAITGTKDEIKKWNAEEIEGGFAPDGVSEGDNKLDDDGNTIKNYQAIDQSKLVPLLVKSLQEALTEIDTLKTKVAALESA